jgi:soluble cytochrome b562
MYMKFLANKPKELKKIMADAHEVHGYQNGEGEPIEDLDDVKLLIQEVSAGRDIKMCKNLDACIE